VLREHAIQLEGRIVEKLSRSVFRVELDNGHRLVAFASRQNRVWAAQLKLGDRVKIEVSPSDFSSGRIRGKLEAERMSEAYESTRISQATL